MHWNKVDSWVDQKHAKHNKMNELKDFLSIVLTLKLIITLGKVPIADMCFKVGIGSVLWVVIINRVDKKNLARMQE